MRCLPHRQSTPAVWRLRARSRRGFRLAADRANIFRSAARPSRRQQSAVKQRRTSRTAMVDAIEGTMVRINAHFRAGVLYLQTAVAAGLLLPGTALAAREW